MSDSKQNVKTVGLNECLSCASGILETDKYCRWCGASQISTPIGSTVTLPEASAYATSVLASTPRADVYRRVSAPLVSAVISGALAGPAIEKSSPTISRLILALISLPVWLIIVLLSPFDAYAAVRNLTRQA